MPALINSDDGVVSGTSGLKTTGANDGILALQTNGSTAMTVNASQNVGVGTSNPAARLHTAQSNASGVAQIFFQNTAGPNNVGQGVQLSFGTDSGSSTTVPNGYIRSLNTAGVGNAAAMAFGTFTGSVIQEQMRISSAGFVTTPNQPAFRAFYTNIALRLPGGEIPFNTTDLNVGNHYNTSTGRFTAPVAGVYQINLTVQHDGLITDGGWMDIRRNGAETRLRYELVNSMGYTAGAITVTISLNAGDYVSAVSSATPIWWSHHTCFSGFLVG